MRRITKKRYKEYLAELVLTTVLQAEQSNELFAIHVHTVLDVVAVTRALEELRYDFPNAENVSIELLSVH